MQAADWGDVYFTAVGTPQKGESAADLRYVDAVDKLAPLVDRDVLILGKSTVLVGTCAKLIERVDSLSEDAKIEIAWNPEFLREGFATLDMLRPDEFRGGRRDRHRIVIGRRPGGMAAHPRTLRRHPRTRYAVHPYRSRRPSNWSRCPPMPSGHQDLVHQRDRRGVRARRRRRPLRRRRDRIRRPDRTPLPQRRHRIRGGCLPKDIRAFTARIGELGASEALTFLREVDNVNMRRRTEWWMWQGARAMDPFSASTSPSWAPHSSRIPTMSSPHLHSMSSASAAAGCLGDGVRPEGRRDLQGHISDPFLWNVGGRRG